ncbi:MAG TPA: S41 family peptidase [Pseudomonadales bacterium]|nr:S41 family peptidase [Pseudomonadales bacterium]
MNPGNDDGRKPRPRRLRPIFLFAFTFVFGLGAGMLFDRWSLMAFVPSDAVANLRLIGEAWNIIEHYYVDRSALDPQKLTYGAIAGMVDALGDNGHSVFLTPGLVKQLDSTEKGELKGVGVQIKIKDKQMVIVAPIDGSPAQRAGLRSGEIILSVDGRDIAGMSPNEAVQQISGPVGTTVELGILDPKTRKVRDVTIKRAEIKLHDVAWVQLPGTDLAYVRLAGFDDNVTKDLRVALKEVQSQHMKGLILDMRDNPGGILDEAVSTASQFLSSGNVLLVKDANGQIKSVPVQPGGLATNIPMAVLINNGSASAAEIVAGALGVPHRAALIGDTTFGTGTVLNEFQLPGGSAMLLAVQEWLTPDGQSFWHKGIPPQIAIELPQGASRVEIGDLREMSADELQDSDDKPLLKAIQVLGQQISGGAGQK